MTSEPSHEAELDEQPYQEPPVVEGLQLPQWIRVFLGICAVVFVVSLVRLPGAIGQALTYERGLKAMRESRHEDAIRLLTQAHKDSGDPTVKMDLIEAEINANAMELATKHLLEFEGVEVTQYENERLTLLAARINQGEEVEP
ncbi:MAG: hypothetical protein ACOYON_14425 [Fimbriimonas sp.]